MEVVQTETHYFLVQPSKGAEDCGQLCAALEGLPGVQAVKPTGLTLMTREAEIAVTVVKGKATPQALRKAFAKAGVQAEPEMVDTWHLSLAPAKQPAELVKSALAKVEGVTAVAVAGSGEVKVSGYAPHVSTEQLLNAVKAAGREATVQTEQVAVKVKGADSPGKLEEAKGRLAQAMGVLEAKAGKDGAIALVREKGRGGRDCLNHALKGTGWSVEFSG